MLKFVLISVVVAGASAGYSSSQYAGSGTSSGLYNQVTSNIGNNAYADKFPYTNTGYNGGFTSNYAGQNGVGAAAGSGVFTPGFATFQQAPVYPNVFDFNGFYQGLQNNFANSATQAFATPGAMATASASLYGQNYPHHHHHQQRPDPGYPSHSSHNNQYQPYDGYSNYNPNNLYQQQLAHQNALFNGFRQQQASFASNTGGGAGHFGNPGYAGASASFGPAGFHQTAQVFPQNPNSPNINTRFGGDSQQGGPGYVGVSSSSFSSNVNGQSHREASTSVNDNGKVTTYHVRS